MRRRSFVVLLALLATCVVGPVMVIALSGLAATTVQCDGTVPRWMIPSVYSGGGCVELRPAWEALLPENRDRQELVCLGYCLDGTPMAPIGVEDERWVR